MIKKMIGVTLLVFSIALAGCGGKKDKSGETAKGVTEDNYEEVLQKAQVEASRDMAKRRAQEEEDLKYDFVATEEIKNAKKEDGLVQIYDVVLKLGESAQDVKNKLDKSKYLKYQSTAFDTNETFVSLFEDTKEVITIMFKKANYSDNNITGTLTFVGANKDDAKPQENNKHIWFAGGINDHYSGLTVAKLKKELPENKFFARGQFGGFGAGQYRQAQEITQPGAEKSVTYSYYYQSDDVDEKIIDIDIYYGPGHYE